MPLESPLANNRTGSLISLVLLAEVCALCLRSWLQGQFESNGISNSKDLSYLIVLPILLFVLAPVLRDHGQVILQKLRPKDLSLRIIGTSILLGIALRVTYWSGMLVAATASLPKAAVEHLNETAHIWFSCPGTSTLALHFLVLALLTPLIEEAIFRGWLLHWLSPHGRWVAIVATAALFALLHVWQSIPFAFVFGLFAAVYVLNTGSLWGALIVHATFNSLIALDWLCMHYVWQPTTQTPATLLTGIAALSIGILALLASILLVRSKVAGHAPDD